jgi:hypothetical protein
MFSGTAQFSHQVCQFFLSVLCVVLCVWLWWIKTNNDLYTSMNVKVASLLFILESWVPWDDAIVVSASKLRKLWDSLSELCSSLCERRLERIVLRPALLPVKTAQFTHFFRQVWSHTVKSLFNWECIAPLTHIPTTSGPLYTLVQCSPNESEEFVVLLIISFNETL